MKTLELLKATKEVVKQFANIENMSEDKYREECKKAIQRAFDVDEITSEIIMYLSEGDWYCRPLDNENYILTWYEKENKIRAMEGSIIWRHNTVYEFNANVELEEILKDLDEIDKKKSF